MGDGWNWLNKIMSKNREFHYLNLLGSAVKQLFDWRFLMKKR